MQSPSQLGANEAKEISAGPDGSVATTLLGNGPVRRDSLFYGFRAEEYGEICRSARTKTLAPGETLYRAGDPVRQIFYMVGGLVKVTHLGSHGAEIILRFGAAGDVLGGLELFSTDRHCTSSQAFRQTRTLVWEAPTFTALVQRHPRLLHNVVRAAGRQLFQLGERFFEVATERVSARVARQVIRLIDQMGRPVNGHIEMTISREDVAKMTGTTLFTVSRLFSAWDAEGLIKTRRRGLTVCDIESLRAKSQEAAVSSQAFGLE